MSSVMLRLKAVGAKTGALAAGRNEKERNDRRITNAHIFVASRESKLILGPARPRFFEEPRHVTQQTRGI